MIVINNQYKNILYLSALNNHSIGNHSQLKSTSHQNYSSPQRISNQSLAVFVVFIIGIISVACGLIIFSLNQAKSANESVFDKDIQWSNENSALEMG